MPTEAKNLLNSPRLALLTERFEQVLFDDAENIMALRELLSTS